MDYFNEEIGSLAGLPYYEELLDEPLGKCFNCGAEIFEDTLYKKQGGYLFDSIGCYESVFYGGGYDL